MFVTDVMLDEVIIEPKYFFGNPHARQLMDKELVDEKLIEEFLWYRDHISRLATFAERLHYVKIFPDYTFPDRPTLPPRGQFQNRAKLRRKKPAK